MRFIVDRRAVYSATALIFIGVLASFALGGTLTLTDAGMVLENGTINMGNNNAIWMENSSGTPSPVLFLDSNNHLHLGYGTDGAGGGLDIMKTKIPFDMSNQIISNIGADSTDFGTSGQLTIGPSSAVDALFLDQDEEANALYIDSEATTNTSAGALLNLDALMTPAIYMKPLATAPATCTEGSFYADDSGSFCYCNDTDTWHDLVDSGGACT